MTHTIQSNGGEKIRGGAHRMKVDGEVLVALEITVRLFRRSPTAMAYTTVFRKLR
jgi:hypothetical protein